MIVFSTFFDGSGHQDDPNSRVVTVAGCASTEAKWSKFETEWQSTLKAEGLTLFHMKEFAHSTGEFKSWRGDEPRRRRLIKMLHKMIILARTSRRFSASVIRADYRAVNKAFKMSEMVGQPFTVAAQFAMTTVNNWMRRNHPNDGMLYIFESGDDDQAELEDLSKHLTFLEVQPIFVEKKADVGIPLQAADFFAYESAKALNDYEAKGKTRARMSGWPLMPKQRDQGFRFIDENMLRLLCRDLGVSRR